MTAKDSYEFQACLTDLSHCDQYKNGARVGFASSLDMHAFIVACPPVKTTQTVKRKAELKFFDAVQLESVSSLVSSSLCERTGWDAANDSFLLLFLLLIPFCRIPLRLQEIFPDPSKFVGSDVDTDIALISGYADCAAAGSTSTSSSRTQE